MKKTLSLKAFCIISRYRLTVLDIDIGSLIFSVQRELLKLKLCCLLWLAYWSSLTSQQTVQAVKSIKINPFADVSTDCLCSIQSTVCRSYSSISVP